MAEEEEDFGALPLPDRFVHKNWKVRKSGYEDAAKAFESTPDESDPMFRPFVLDSGLWKGAVLDSNVAAQQEGVAALCAFLKYGGQEACRRSRNVTISPLVEKGLSSTKAGTKQSSLEAILLYVELDKADPILEDLLAGLSNKQPKIVAATLGALRELYHAYGVKIVEPKPALKALPKAFSHADKNVRAEATNLTVELYRWLRAAMKRILWEELKPTQQGDLEKLFEKVDAEPAPKQARLLLSQQQKVEAAAVAGDEDVGEVEAEDEPEEQPEFDLAEPVDVLSKIPLDFYDNMASAKWKDRKDALDVLYAAANTEKIKEGHFDECVQVLAKSMKDANIAVVTVAANCVDVIAKGLRRSFAKYRSKIMPAIMERLKEKKQTIADALGQALDSIFASSNLTDCLEDILEFLKHKNPQVKAETLNFLIRCLKTTREAPSKPECKSIADAATKLLTESSEATRSGGAEVLGTLMKIMGERAMGPYMEPLDDIRKTKIKEYCEKAVVKAKDKPKPVMPPPKAAAPATTKRTVAKKPPAGLGYKAPSKRASTPQSEKRSPPPKAQPVKAIPTKLSAPKSGLAAPSAGLKKKLPGAGPPPSLASPARRNITPLSDDDPVPAPKLGRGLAGRPLGKPSLAAPDPPPPSAPVGLTDAEREELEDLRADKDRLQRSTDDLRAEKSRLTSQIHELQNHNAELIEDHTRDVLSIKAKETQLVRARSDAEAAEGMVQRLQRENERLKRELSRTARSGPDSPLADDRIYRDSNSNSLSSSTQPPAYERSVSGRSGAGYDLGSPSEEKENGSLDGPVSKPALSRGLSGAAAREEEGERPVADWKRAGEVTSQLKARIEQMKVCRG